MIVHFVESLGGIQAVHAFRREPRNQEIFEHLDDRYRARQLLVAAARRGATGPACSSSAGSRPRSCSCYGGYLVLDGHMTRRRAGRVPALPAPVLRADAGAEPVLQPVPGRGRRRSRSCRACSRRRRASRRAGAPDRRSPHAHGELALRRRAASRTASAPVLHHLDLDIPAGQTVALVGATGAGKTTIARLAARFWDPTDGHACTLDGIDLRDLDRADLRRAVVTVTQENFLFSGSVADNIRFGQPGRVATPRSKPRRAPSARTSSSPRCPTATTPTCTRRARGSRPGSASWSRSRARSSPIPRC